MMTALLDATAQRGRAAFDAEALKYLGVMARGWSKRDIQRLGHLAYEAAEAAAIR